MSDCNSNKTHYSENLFKNEKEIPMAFHVYPTQDSKRIIQLIKDGGGEIVEVDHPGSIHIVSGRENCHNENNVSASFIYASCLENKLLDLNAFRIQEPCSILVLQPLIDDLEQLLSTTEKKMWKIIKYIVADDHLWRRIHESQEFGNQSWTSIRNSFNLWAFLNLKSNKAENERYIRKLLSHLKGYPQQNHLSCNNESKACEESSTSAEAERISDVELSVKKKKKKDNFCSEVESTMQRSEDDSKAFDVPSPVISRIEDVAARRVESSDDAANEEKNKEINGVVIEDVTQACIGDVTNGKSDSVSDQLILEGSVDERIGEVNKESNLENGTLQESDGSANVEKELEGETVRNEDKKIITRSVNSGMWLGKRVMKNIAPLNGKDNEKKDEEDCIDADSTDVDSTDVDSADVDESDHKNGSARRKLGRFQQQNLYSYQEDLVILKWVLKTRNSYWPVQGNRIWKFLEKKRILPKRSWQSMKERFKRHITRDLSKYNLGEADLKKIKKLL